ncbi:MAG TPA: sigma-54 dependent transcriptional regulator [Candidatus Sulfotelmatobacter sp.]|nr:sigma-54 dependent transcriptional regulator [Candidatus Sulfotelmatobacter sp.]
MADDRRDLLFVDDDERIREALRPALERQGFRVTEASSAEQALELIEERRFDSILLDIRLDGMSGLDALTLFRERAPETGVVMLSGDATASDGATAILRGAVDFIEKPVVGEEKHEHLYRALETASRVSRVRRSVAPPRDAEAGGELRILGESPAIRALIESIRKIAPSQARVLIHGENGSGKELVAAAIHALSKRAGGPLVKINCAAIPKDLVESELFGYEKGAFTGAMQSKKGRFEQADGGSLFLDEIGELSAEAQAKLLRAIESGEIEHVGGTRPVRCDVRVISATNRDLSSAIESGEFRQDLYFRLNVLPIRVPALRERPGDVGLLARHFLERFCVAEGRRVKTLSPASLQLLENYSWPGNVRELRNLMERAAILVEPDVIEPEALVVWLESTPGADEAVGLRGEIERREAEAVRKALEAAGGNVTQAATALGIDRTNLHRKLRKYGIQRR